MGRLGAIGTRTSLAAMAVLLTACGTSSPVTSSAPGSATAAKAANSSSDRVLHLVAIGDSIPFGGHFCPGCTSFVDLYGAELEKRFGRQVIVFNRSRDDSATMQMIESQLAEDASLGRETAEADVVIVSVGFNNALPDPATGVGCLGDAGTTVESYVRWVLASAATCQQAGLDTYAAMYDRILAAITALRAGKPTVFAVINVHDGNLGSPDFANAQLPKATKTEMDRWMVDWYDRWNAMECERATAHGFACIDVYHAFNGPKGDQPSGSVNTIDGAHPSQAGNDLIAGLLAKLDTAAIGP